MKKLSAKLQQFDFSITVHIYSGDPVVVITTNGSIIAGNVYTLTCTVTVVTGVPNITWSDPDGNIVNGSLNSNTELVLEFSSLNYADIGEYICSANLSIPEFNFLGMGSDSITVDIQSMIFCR